MRVLIIGINYRPEVAGIGPYTTRLAEHLRQSGDEVAVIAGLPHYPQWRIRSGTRRRLLARELVAGVDVIRAGHFVPTRQTAAGRGLYEGTFLLTGLLGASIAGPRPDVVLGIVPALAGGIAARLVAQRHGVRYGVLFQDLMGPGSSQSGIEGGQAVARLTSRAEAWVARRASAVGVISEAFEPYLEEIGVAPSRIHVVPNWARPMPATVSPDEVRAAFGWSDGRTVLLHGGNIGLKQGLEQAVVAARLASQRGRPIRLVFVGGGNQEAAIRRLATGLDNVDFLGVQPDGVYASLLRAADVLLLSERASQLTMSLPSKLTSYLTAARPIVAAVPPGGSTERAFRAAGAGLLVPAGDAEGILDAVTRLAGDPELARRLAEAGEQHARERFEERSSLERATAFVHGIAGPGADR